jgi:hypothetical protein
MNRRAILAILTGSAASLYSRFALAANADRTPLTVAKLPSESTGDSNGKVAKTASDFPDLKRAGRGHEVRSLAYSRGAYRVKTVDGKSIEFLEPNLRFKIDSSDLGPRPGTPIIMPAGTEGDRVWVFFASPNEISGFIDRDWS